MMFSNSQFKIFSFSIMSNAKWKIKVITRWADIKLYPERPQMEFISFVNTNCHGILINITNYEASRLLNSMCSQIPLSVIISPFSRHCKLPTQHFSIFSLIQNYDYF